MSLSGYWKIPQPLKLKGGKVINRVLFYILVIGGIALYPSESKATVVVNESQANIRFIKGDFTEETTDDENGQSSTTDTEKNETNFPKTGEKKLNYLEGVGTSLVGLTFILIKIKKTRKEDLS